MPRFRKHSERAGDKRRLGSPEYKAWEAMRRRCSNPRDKDFALYGGRGIGVCERWQASFENFLIDMGRRPSAKHSLDRFPNRNGDYTIGNCRWADPFEQARNRSNNVPYLDAPTISVAAARIGINYKTVKSRLGHGWTLEDALTKPVNERKRLAARNSHRTSGTAGAGAGEG